MPTIGIVVSPEQLKILRQASSAAGQGLGPWLRGLGLAAARTVGIRPVDPEKQAAKAAHAAGVAARRDRRNALRAARVAEDLAWTELARCQDLERAALASGEGYEEARAARVAADSAAVAARDAREALEA